LLGGLLGEIALQAKGLRLGKTDEFLKQKGFDKFIPEFKELFSLYGKKIHLPVDVAIEKRAVRREIPVTDLPSEHPIYDVGHHTITNYCDLLDECDLIIHNGPFGVYEATQFRVGTREILETIHHCKGFSLVGGGDTVTALVGIGYRKSDFGHVSLAGGALLEYLAGSDLPGLKALMTD
jgi:phosphoglycerate kinase